MDVDKESTASSNLVGNDIIEFPAGYVYWKFDRHWPIFFSNYNKCFKWTMTKILVFIAQNWALNLPKDYKRKLIYTKFNWKCARIKKR